MTETMQKRFHHDSQEGDQQTHGCKTIHDLGFYWGLRCTKSSFGRNFLVHGCFGRCCAITSFSFLFFLLVVVLP
jgi:hypothetical protein